MRRDRRAISYGVGEPVEPVGGQHDVGGLRGLAVEPRAPIAIPTSAAASAGASLTPSPTITVTAFPRSARTAGDLVGRGLLGGDLVEAQHGADLLGRRGTVTGEHHQAGHPGRA